MTNELLVGANEALTDLEKLFLDARDVLFNLADDIRAQVPDCMGKTVTLDRINKLRSKL